MEENKKYFLFIGKFQPFHNGHDYIIKQALEDGKLVWIAIRDTGISAQSPYTAQERFDMISAHYKNKENVLITIIPDIESINTGKNTDYEAYIHKGSKETMGISSEKIRKMMLEKDDSWKKDVPRIIVDHLKEKGNLFLGENKGMVIWITGVPGTGKNTLANALFPFLVKNGKRVRLLTSSEIKKYLTADLGFSKEDFLESAMRISFVIKTIADIGGIAICTDESPYKKDREKIRELVGEDRFFEIHADCNKGILFERDVEGFYEKETGKEILNLYEDPEDPQCKVDIGWMTIEESVNLVLEKLERFLNPKKRKRRR